MYQRTRPAEWQHDRKCMAEALISAVQNFRDQEQTDLDFHLMVQNGGLVQEAYEYLRIGLQDCICDAPWPNS